MASFCASNRPRASRLHYHCRKTSVASLCASYRLRVSALYCHCRSPLHRHCRWTSIVSIFAINSGKDFLRPYCRWDGAASFASN
mmetsp:Transcript_20875/g.62433  ORF Transcript_20875/g.62433 Transcript_20875/m.62433 type:complete len:84 (+) Transcript_20875:797-1048(+)